VGKNEMTKQFLAVEDLTSLVLSRVSGAGTGGT
jgi:hypothetical protein